MGNDLAIANTPSSQLPYYATTLHNPSALTEYLQSQYGISIPQPQTGETAFLSTYRDQETGRTSLRISLSTGSRTNSLRTLLTFTTGPETVINTVRTRGKDIKIEENKNVSRATQSTSAPTPTQETANTLTESDIAISEAAIIQLLAGMERVICATDDIRKPDSERDKGQALCEGAIWTLSEEMGDLELQRALMSALKRPADSNSISTANTK